MRKTDTGQYPLTSATRIGTLLAGVVLALTACGASGVRPYLTPLSDAIVDSIGAQPANVIREIAELVVGEGLQIRLASPVEGYLETDWYDIVAGRSGGGNALDPNRAVLLRFFADPAGESRTRLVSEAVVHRSVDPSLPRRENEVMAPPGHPGEQILLRILTALEARLGGSRQ